MASRIATITIDPDNCEVSVDLTGFKGKGCSLIQAEFAKGGGTVTKDLKKPEYKAITLNQVCK